MTDLAIHRQQTSHRLCYLHSVPLIDLTIDHQHASERFCHPQRHWRTLPLTTNIHLTDLPITQRNSDCLCHPHSELLKNQCTSEGLSQPYIILLMNLPIHSQLMSDGSSHRHIILLTELPINRHIHLTDFSIHLKYVLAYPPISRIFDGPYYPLNVHRGRRSHLPKYIWWIFPSIQCMSW